MLDKVNNSWWEILENMNGNARTYHLPIVCNKTRHFQELSIVNIKFFYYHHSSPNDLCHLTLTNLIMFS